MIERTWEISDINGCNKRTVTLAQYRAELDAAKRVAIKAYIRNVEIVKREALREV